MEKYMKFWKTDGKKSFVRAFATRAKNQKNEFPKISF